MEKIITALKKDLGQKKEKIDHQKYVQLFLGQDETKSFDPTPQCIALNERADEAIGERCRNKYQTSTGWLSQAGNSDRCNRLELPYVAPHFTIRWGDSSTDRMETEDIEKLCITARNPYNNVSFDCFDIEISTLIAPNWQSPPPSNADGTVSSEITPANQICFGKLGPCESATRELIMINRNALPGNYYWLIQYCGSWSSETMGVDVFDFNYTPS